MTTIFEFYMSRWCQEHLNVHESLHFLWRLLEFVSKLVVCKNVKFRAIDSVVDQFILLLKVDG